VRHTKSPNDQAAWASVCQCRVSTWG